MKIKMNNQSSPLQPNDNICVVRLTGGLGNQMFQYAAGLGLAQLHGRKLYWDSSLFTNNPRRKLEIDKFQLSAEEWAPKGIRRYLLRAACSRHKFLRLLALPWTLANHIVPLTETQPYPSYLLQPGSFPEGKIILEGYWHHFNYFDHIADIVRHEFSLKCIPDDQNKAYLEDITESEKFSVSVHVRREDYLQLRQPHVLSVDYYGKAAEIILEKLGRIPTWFLFSDDLNWAKDNLHFPGRVVAVEGNTQKGWEDLRLMSACRHHIIANSTFSWWGAWLNQQADSVVVIPSRWTGDEPVPPGLNYPGWIECCNT